MDGHRDKGTDQSACVGGAIRIAVCGHPLQAWWAEPRSVSSALGPGVLTPRRRGGRPRSQGTRLDRKGRPVRATHSLVAAAGSRWEPPSRHRRPLPKPRQGPQPWESTMRSRPWATWRSAWSTTPVPESRIPSTRFLPSPRRRTARRLRPWACSRASRRAASRWWTPRAHQTSHRGTPKPEAWAGRHLRPLRAYPGAGIGIIGNQGPVLGPITDRACAPP
jgi:hypothetical protein